MGTICQELLQTPAILQDLKITYHDSSLIFPAQETEKKLMFLSNIDKTLNFNVQTVHFFPSNPKFLPEAVAQGLKKALSKVLVHYDFLAGRLKWNCEINRMEIDCNAAGAGFVVASTEFRLDEIGDLVYPNPAFQALAVQSIEGLGAADDQPLCIVQVTSFKCGGFVIGFSTNHCTFDGIGFRHFLNNLASQSYDDEKPLAIIPCNDRRLLAARSPPRVTFPHPELCKLNLPLGEEPLPHIFDCSTENLDARVLRLSSDDISHLKNMAKTGLNKNTTTKLTGFNVVAAHIWRCKALSSNANLQNPNRLSTVLYAVNIRQRIQPSLPESYTGNAVLSAYAIAPCTDLEAGPFSRIVDMVTEGSTRISEEYVWSAVDWGEIYNGFPNGEFLLSSWWRLGFEEVEYPWGKPKYSCPIVYHRKDIILLFPDINDGAKAVNVFVALPADEMEKFQILFYKFLKY